MVNGSCGVRVKVVVLTEGVEAAGAGRRQGVGVRLGINSNFPHSLLSCFDKVVMCLCAP